MSAVCGAGRQIIRSGPAWSVPCDASPVGVLVVSDRRGRLPAMEVPLCAEHDRLIAADLAAFEARR